MGVPNLWTSGRVWASEILVLTSGMRADLVSSSLIQGIAVTRMKTPGSHIPEKQQGVKELGSWMQHIQKT